jgi:hypothetical protein
MATMTKTKIKSPKFKTSIRDHIMLSSPARLVDSYFVEPVLQVQTIALLGFPACSRPEFS